MVNISEAIKLGENLFTSGDLDNALIIFQNILESNPEQYEAMINIGTIYYLKEDISTAESYYLNSYSINNDYIDVLLNLTDVYIND
jgi:tetratricopeptide (TPR) repeat protein